MSIVPSTTPHINTRLLNANEERLNTLSPIRGYAGKPYVSLKDAVKPLHSLIGDVDARVWTATNRSQSTAEILNPDESAAIVLYTIEWDPDHPSLYSILNNTLRSENRDGLKSWFSYLKLLLSGLFKIPSVQCTVWRGVREDLSRNYKVGDFYTWWAFSSCTASISMLMEERYLGQTDSCTLFSIECFNGKNIKDYSYFAYENEVLLLPCTYFQVINKFSRRDGLHIIHLREESPPHMLLEPPFPISTDFVSDQLNNKQYQAILKQIIKEKECLENRCNEQQIQISRLESENDALKKHCDIHEEKIINMTAIISCITEDNEYLTKEIQRLNHENECLKSESQCIGEEPELARLTIEDSNNSSTEIQETAKCLTTSDSTPSDMISNKAYRYSIMLMVHTVDARNTLFAKTGDLYVSVHVFNDHKQTTSMAPSLPLLIEETLYFEKDFNNCISPANIIDQLEDENILIEFCQTTNAQPICLAIYEIKAKDFLYPYSSNRIEYKVIRRSIILDRTENMSGISPTFTFSVSPKVEQVFSSI